MAESFLWIAGEVWLNHVAQDERRGRTVALYGMVAGGGFALGPLLLAVALTLVTRYYAMQILQSFLTL